MTSIADKENILFGKFAVIECLKKDEFTSVYRARHLFLDKDIILKLLNTNLITDQEIISRFKREARILARLDHTNIIKVLDFGDSEKILYISFMYFKSHSLREIINQNQVNNDEKIELLEQLLNGISAAHQAGVIHRDLKPDNILVNQELELKIADFGLALVEEESIVTQKASIVGTPGYMSPEQIRGEQLTPKSDLFAVGIITFELFTGKNPFLASDLNSTLNNILNFNYDQLDHQGHQYPRGVEEILMNTLQNNPARRTDIASSLLSFITERSTIKPKKVYKRKYKILLIVLILFVISILIFWQTVMPHLGQTTAPVKQEIKDNHPVESMQENIEVIVPDSQIETSIAEQNNFVRNTETREIRPAGNLFLSVYPQASVKIDSGNPVSVNRDTIFQLDAGRHVLKLFHPDYPAHEYLFNILPGEITTYRVALDTLSAYFHCTVYPWGEVYIDRAHMVQTPFFSPLRLSPGKHLVQIKNPGFPEFADSLIFIPGDTLNLKIDLEKLSDKNESG